MRLRSLRAAWTRAPWIRRLSGLTSPPSTLQAGVDRWIASLRDSHASRTATPAPAREPPTSAGYGPTSRELFASLVRGLWCSKTSQDSFLPADSLPFSQTWPRWGSLRNGECYRQEAWAPAIDASGCSSWPTVTRACANGNAQTAANPLPGQTGGDTIAGIAQQWQTPVVPKGGGLTRGGNRSGEALLAGQSQQWPTPSASIANDGESQESWNARKQLNLAKHANGNGMGTPLTIASTAWPTPASRDAKGANSELHVTETGGGASTWTN